MPVPVPVHYYYSSFRYFSRWQLYSPLPDEFTFGDVKRHIANQLPSVDSPSLFGMTSDAEMTYMEDQAQKIISTVLSVQPNLAVNIKAGYVYV